MIYRIYNEERLDESKSMHRIEAETIINYISVFYKIIGKKIQLTEYSENLKDTINQYPHYPINLYNCLIIGKDILNRAYQSGVIFDTVDYKKVIIEMICGKIYNKTAKEYKVMVELLEFGR